MAYDGTGKAAMTLIVTHCGMNSASGPVCQALYNRLQDIQYGRAEDKFGWTIEIE